MFDRLEAIERRYEELNNMIALPELSTNPSRLQALAQEQASLDEAVHKYRLYKAISEAIQETQAMMEEKMEPDLVFLAKEELNDLRERQQKIINELKQLPYLLLTFFACTTVMLKLKIGRLKLSTAISPTLVVLRK